MDDETNIAALNYARGLIKAVEIVYAKTTRTADIRMVMEILTELNAEISKCKQ